VATAAGTSGSRAPTWPQVVGNTVTDGTVSWQNAGYGSLRPFPDMALVGSGGKLYEYLGTIPTEKGTPTAGKSATFKAIRAELLSNTPVGGGLSSAIFWTSDGLHTLGQAIVENFNGIPIKIKNVSSPPRNAVYVFEYTGSLPPSDNASFNPPTNPTKYLQCFNIKINVDLTDSPLVGGTYYYCSKKGNLPEEIRDLTLLRGKVCDTTNLGADCAMVP